MLRRKIREQKNGVKEKGIEIHVARRERKRKKLKAQCIL